MMSLRLGFSGLGFHFGKSTRLTSAGVSSAMGSYFLPFPSTLLALRSIWAFSDDVILPFLSCWLALALALAAWLLSGIGYLRSSGSPKVLPLRFSRFLGVSSAML